MTRVALDAMGGDGPPHLRVAAAERVRREHGVEVVLVGDPGLLRGTDLPVVAASQVIEMGDEAALAIRARQGASIRVAMRLLAAGDVQAVLSAGSTGATLAAALLDLGRLPGVRRPVVAVVLPVGGPAPSGVVLIDAGASPDVQPEALVAHAHLGAAYARAREVAQPRIGLLNVGSEPGKGNELARAAHKLLGDVDGFAGNVEPADVLTGAVDVVVTDGFTGNVFLKAVEAASPLRVSGPGAALLLGVAGPVLVAHGAADTDDLMSALRDAASIASTDLTARLADALRVST